QVLQGSTNVGDVVAIVNYAMRVSMAISMFAFIIMAFSRAKASIERISDVLEEDVDLVDNPLANQRLGITDAYIAFHDFSIRYLNSNDDVLKNNAYTIQRKHNVAILRATGSGKTSLFQVIQQLHVISSSEILIDNREISHYTLIHLRKSIGSVSQNSL